VEVVAPEGKAFDTRCTRMKFWSELLCALWDSSSVAKMLLLTISTKSYELGSLDCLEQMIIHEMTITRWIPQSCREQQDKPCKEETNRDRQRQKSCREVLSNE
jgi:tRNA-splicing endonuclease subunit Sen2